MIRLTRLKHGPFLVNPDLIEHLETTPDTVITLTNGHQFMVLEPADEVVRRVIEYRRAICPQLVHCAPIPEADEPEKTDQR